jgi:hypothetical protein
MAYYYRSYKIGRSDKPFQVAGVIIWRIGRRPHPLAIAMPALIERQ